MTLMIWPRGRHSFSTSSEALPNCRVSTDNFLQTRAQESLCDRNRYRKRRATAKGGTKEVPHESLSGKTITKKIITKNGNGQTRPAININLLLFYIQGNIKCKTDDILTSHVGRG